ncbi:MAG: heme biosynthesis HemY N-terminal domain-containing protein [Pseudomonadota bacterium]
MLKTIIYLLAGAVIVVAGASALDALVAEPGTLSLDYGGRLYEFKLYEAALLLLVGIVAILFTLAVLRFVYALVMFVLGDETAFSRFFVRSRERRGMDALSKAMMALAAGDGKLAMKKAKLAEKNLRRPDLTRLVNAQAADLAGDKARAQTYYKALMSEDTTAFLGTQGLLGYAIEAEDTDKALTLANHAHELAPKHGGALEALYTLQSQKFDWAGARKTVKEQKRRGLLPKPEAQTREAALAFAEAEDAERTGETERARALAVEAAKLDPANVDASAGAARLLIESGAKRAASKIVIESWRFAPHPKLAAAFAAIEPDEAPAARRRRFEQLFAIHPNHDETQFMKAELALVDEDWSGARRAIEDLRETEPSARSCAVFAAIARGEGDPDHVVQGWLARGLGAPRTGASDSVINNAAMLPLLMGARDDTGMEDVTAGSDAASEGDDAGSHGAGPAAEDAETVEAGSADTKTAKAEPVA